MGAYPAERGKRGPPAAPCPGRYPARSRLRTSTRFRRQGCSRFSSYPRPKRSGGTCGSQPVEPTANDVIGASCPHGRLFRSGHQSPLLNTKEPLCPAPLVENPRTGSSCSKRPKSIEFYRILQRHQLGAAPCNPTGRSQGSGAPSFALFAKGGIRKSSLPVTK
jgi:hypothetical protein